MTESPHLREYRMNRRVSAAFFIPAGLGLVGAALPFLMADDVPTWVSALVLVLLAGLAVWVAAALLRSATVVRREHIMVHGAFRTREIAWSDIQGIRVEEIANTAEHDLPQRVVAVYGGDGRRLGLPHLNEKALGTPRTLHDEVRALCEMWLRWRGDDWEPVPEVEAKMAAKSAKEAADRLYALTPGRLASVAAGGAFPVIMGVFLALGLGTDVLSGVSGNVMATGLMGSFVAVFLGFYVTTYLRRRRRHRT